MRRRLLAAAFVIGAALATAISPAQAATSPTPAPSPSSDPYEQQLQQQLAEQTALSATKASLQSEITAGKAAQSSLAATITGNQTAIEQTIGQLANAENELQAATQREATDHAAAVAAQTQERNDKTLLASYLVERYTSQDTFVSYVFGSGSMSEMLSRAADVNHLLNTGAQLTARVEQEAAAAQQAEAAAQADENAAGAATAALTEQQQTLQQETVTAKSLMVSLSQQEQAAAVEIGQANQQSLAVAQAIAATRISQLDTTIGLAEQSDWQAASYWIQQNLGSLPPGFATPSTTPGSAQFDWPAPGATLGQPFGPSPYDFEPPYDGYPHFHTGVDLVRGEGSPIIAAAAGIVVAATPGDVGYGNHIIIAHAGGFLTLYGHLETMLVTPGTVVTAGELIGLMGSTGNSTGPHLHFEVRFNSQPIDPLPFLPAIPPGASAPPTS